MDFSLLPPPSLWPEIPGMLPPQGVTSNFTDPEDRGYIAIVVGSTLTALMLGFFSLRMYTKAFVLKKLTWDDLTCGIAVAGALAYFGAAARSVVHGPIGKHMWDVTLAELLSDDFIISSAYLGAVLTAPIMGVLKLTFFLLYLQLFYPMRWLRISVYVGATIEVLIYGSFTIAMFVLSTPSQGQTWVTHIFSSAEFASQYQVSVPLACLGLGVDLYLLILPLVAISQLQMAWKHKVAVGITFLTGILACVASLLSVYYRVLDNQSSDTTWTSENVILLGLVEMDVGIIVACMPAFSRVVQHHLEFFQSLKSSFYARFSGSHRSDAHLLDGGRYYSDRTYTKHPSTYANSSDRPMNGANRSVEGADWPRQDMQPRHGGSEFELGQVKGVKTSIGAGQHRRQDEKVFSHHRIHLSQEIRQER